MSVMITKTIYQRICAQDQFSKSKANYVQELFCGTVSNDYMLWKVFAASESVDVVFFKRMWLFE